MAREPHQSATQRQVEPATSAVDARQGVISGRVILVLLISLFLAVVALSVGYFAVH